MFYNSLRSGGRDKVALCDPGNLIGSQKPMISAMFPFSCEQIKILGSVVISYVIYMMDILSISYKSSKNIFGYKNVFKYSPSFLICSRMVFHKNGDISSSCFNPSSKPRGMIRFLVKGMQALSTAKLPIPAFYMCGTRIVSFFTANYTMSFSASSVRKPSAFLRAIFGSMISYGRRSYRKFIGAKLTYPCHSISFPIGCCTNSRATFYRRGGLSFKSALACLAVPDSHMRIILFPLMA